jgi:hypothetical protein
VVTQAVAACPAGLAPLLYGQVVLTGGCCKLPGFAARFEEDLRRLAPDELEVVVVAPEVRGARGGVVLVCWLVCSIMGVCVCVCVPQCVCVTQRGVSLYGVTMRVCLFFQLSERVCVIVSEEGVLLE